MNEYNAMWQTFNKRQRCKLRHDYRDERRTFDKDYPEAWTNVMDDAYAYYSLKQLEDESPEY